MLAGMARLTFLIALWGALLAAIDGAGLRNGPMIGYATMAEVLVWVQADGPAEVRVAYWDEADPARIHHTDTVRTDKRSAYVAKCVADEVRAGRTYGYAVYIDGQRAAPQFREGHRDGPIPLAFSTPRNWRFREDGHAPFDFTVGFGSCAYINEPEGGYDRLGGRPYGGEYRIFEAIHDVAPDLFIWLGDNVYYREPDWSSRTGMIHRWTHDRGIPELRAMLATIPQYATWDDHDYGPNDAGREFWNKAMATEIFSLFHGNPTAGLPEIPGIFTYFAWGDVHFYLLDNRTHRTVPGLRPEGFGYAPQQLGKAQIDWMVELMKYNRNQSRSSYPSTFHVVGVGSQVLSPHSRDGLRRYPEEWEYLFDRLVAEELHDVIFITGDVHFSEVSRLERDGHVFWDLTSSPLTAGPWAGPPPQANPWRHDIFPGEADRVGRRNFATLSFEGPLTARRAVIRYYDSDGQLLNQQPGQLAGTPTPASVIDARQPNLDPRLYP
jgi:alkaline phosphatase D